MESKLKNRSICQVCNINNLLSLSNQCNLYQNLNKSNIKNHISNKHSHQHNILMSSFKYMLKVQMCDIDMFLLFYNQYNCLCLIPYKLDIKNYMLNNCNHQYNILISNFKYRFIRLMYNMDKHLLNYRLNKLYLIQNT